MTRTLIGCLFALSLAFVSGCDSGGTEPTVVDQGAATEAAVQAEDDAYEAEMESNDDEGETGPVEAE